MEDSIMGLLSKLLRKNTSSTEPKISGSLSTSTCTNQTPNIPPLQGDYAKTIFLWAHQKASPVRKPDEYARYFIYECGIRNPASYHKDLIEQGVFVPAPIDISLSAMKVAELKQILSEVGQPTTGKKDVLIDRILSNADNNVLKKHFSEKLYIPSEAACSFIKTHYNYVLVHTHKSQWGIDWCEFDANYEPGMSFYDVAWSIFNKRITDSRNLGRNEYFNMYQLLMEEGKKNQAFKMLLHVFYLDLSGVCSLSSLRLYKEGIYTKKDLLEHFDIAITLAPGIITQIAELKDEYDDGIIDWLYEHKLPIQICSKQLFRKIVLSILDGTFDREATTKLLQCAYAKAIKSL